MQQCGQDNMACVLLKASNIIDKEVDMLLLTRKCKESIYLDVAGGIRIKITEIRGQHTVVGIEANPSVHIIREEIRDRYRPTQLTTPYIVNA